MQITSEDDNNLLSTLTKLPIAPFSAFLSDLNRPFFLNNLHPSTEIVKTGANFPDLIETPEKIPLGLFDCSSFNPSKIILNTPPLKEITHEYDEFMLKILEQCYEAKPNVSSEPMTIPNPIISTPVKNIKTTSSINTETVSTPSALKVKLNVANGTSASSSNTGQLLKKLIDDESFVNPLCFDCENDLIIMARIIRSFSLCLPQSHDSDLIASVNEIISKYLGEVLEYLDQSTESIDSVKAAYCICLIGLLNIGRLASNDSLKDYNSFDLIMRFYSLSADFNSSDLIMSIAIESYVALLTKFKIHDTEASSYSSHLFELCFESTGVLTRTSSIVALSQLFAKYHEYRSYIIDQLLMKSSDSESFEVQKFSVAIILTCLQALCSENNANDQSSKPNLVSSILTSCLNYFWKGDGNELPKASNVFFVMMEELQNIFSDFHWPIASTALNTCTIQMFHYVLKDDASSNAKGSILLKLRFLDVLSNVSKTISSDSGPSEKRSIWQSIGQNSFFTTIFSPKLTFESLNSAGIEKFNQEIFSSLLKSGPLSKIPERVTGLFIKLISSEIIQLRSKAIKNLFNLMNSSQLCKSNYDALKASILAKASDSSISVRDAGLEFISKLIFTPPSFENDPKDLIESVISRVKDRGVSVRKRAVKVIGEILQKGIVDGSEMKFACVASLISHISDEDDDVIIDVIFKTLKDQWIMSYLGKDFLNQLPATQRKIMSTFAGEVVEVIGYLQSDIKCLQDFLGKFLVDESIKKEYSAFFAGTVEVLLENLLQSLEGNDMKTLKRSLESISLFSESNPQSLENHLGLLQSLLRSEDSEISLLSMKLISGVIPKASLTEMKKLQEFERDLLGLIYRGSEICVKLSIETLYHYVNNCSHQYGTLSSLWQKFTDYLKARMTDDRIEASSIPHICRALLATGVLCAQSARHREREFGLKDFHSGAQARCLLEFVDFFSRLPVAFIRSCSIQAFGSLIMSCPQVSISSNQLCRNLICTSLSDTEDESCKMKMLLIFDQMIKRFDGGSIKVDSENTNNNNTGSNILVMEGDESYFSALIQEHLQLISNCVITSESLEVRGIALKICSSSAIFGLVNPQLIIPYLAVGLNSENDHIQAFSRNSYERLLTRFPSMISKDLLLAGKLLYRQCPTTASAQNQSKLSFYYTSLRGKTGKVGIEALSGIFNYFESIITRTENFNDSNGISFIKFLIELIVTLPFSNSEEVLNVLQRIQGIFSMSSDWINNDEQHIEEKFTLLKGLSYSVNYLIKSYPQVVGMTMATEDEEETVNIYAKLVQRVPVTFEFPLTESSASASVEFVQNFIANQISIPNLLNQQNPLRKRKNLENVPAEDDEDFDVTNFLIDDEEISESESEDDEDEEEEEFDVVANSKKQSQKPQKSQKIQKKTVSKPQVKKNTKLQKRK